MIFDFRRQRHGNHQPKQHLVLARLSLLSLVFVGMEKRDAPSVKSFSLFIQQNQLWVPDQSLRRTDGVPSPHTLSEDASHTDGVVIPYTVWWFTQRLISVVMAPLSQLLSTSDSLLCLCSHVLTPACVFCPVLFSL